MLVSVILSQLTAICTLWNTETSKKIAVNGGLLSLKLEVAKRNVSTKKVYIMPSSKSEQNSLEDLVA